MGRPALTFLHVVELALVQREIAAIITRWVWRQVHVRWVCVLCAVFCMSMCMYMSPGMCAQYIWKGEISGLRGKGKDKFLSLLCLLGSGLPSCLHVLTGMCVHS